MSFSQNMSAKWKKSVQLRPITRSDLHVLLKWRNSESFTRFCSKRRDRLTEVELDRELQADFARDRHRQILISAHNDQQPIGTMYSYGYSPEDGYLFVTIYLDETERHRGLGVIAFIKFCQQLFDELDLFKIYMDVYEYNTTVLRQLRRAGCAEEGRFRGHRRDGETRHDTLRFAIYRDAVRRTFVYRKQASSRA